MAATQEAQVCRVHCEGSVMSGCSTASHRPALAMMVRTMSRTLRVSGEVACHFSTHWLQVGWAPSITAMVLWVLRTGGWQCPRAATARCRA
jgi:hypothetical protein